MDCFSDSYEAGREKFLRLCESETIPVNSCINPDATTMDGKELAMDTIWLGPKEAASVVLIINGTHGLEAAAGAATILDWIQGGAYLRLPDNVAVMVIHTINPYGWAYSCRTNEDNIDLNRNYLDHEKPPPKNRFYRQLHDLVVSDDMSDSGLEHSLGNFHDFGKSHGTNTAIHGICGGQYDNPQGLSYGGRELSWSHRTLGRLVRENLHNAAKIVTIDWHTGIGDFARPFFIMMEGRQSEMFGTACDWWGREYIHNEDIFDGVGSEDYSGLLIQGLRREMAKLTADRILNVSIEWGTYRLDTMLQALLMDRWLRCEATSPESPEALMIKSRLIECFCPSEPAWRQAVLTGSRRIYQQALDGINSW